MALHWKATTPSGDWCSRHEELYAKDVGKPWIRRSFDLSSFYLSPSNCRSRRNPFRRRSALQTFGMQVQCLDKDDQNRKFLREGCQRPGPMSCLSFSAKLQLRVTILTPHRETSLNHLEVCVARVKQVGAKGRRNRQRSS
jgi:hypothetical protein